MMELLNEYKYVSTVSENARSKGFVRITYYTIVKCVNIMDLFE